MNLHAKVECDPSDCYNKEAAARENGVVPRRKSFFCKEIPLQDAPGYKASDDIPLEAQSLFFYPNGPCQDDNTPLGTTTQEPVTPAQAQRAPHNPTADAESTNNETQEGDVVNTHSKKRAAVDELYSPFMSNRATAQPKRPAIIDTNEDDEASGTATDTDIIYRHRPSTKASVYVPARKTSVHKYAARKEKFKIWSRKWRDEV